MSLIQYAESGAEQFIPYAKKKLRELHAYMIQTGVASFAKRIDVSGGSAIYLNSLLMGHGVFADKIRITGGSSIAVILDAALIPDIDTTLLDAEYSDFGLVLPKSVRGLPRSFKAGGVLQPPDPNKGKYRGMIVNHAFKVLYPLEYVDPGVATYLAPFHDVIGPGSFRYFSDLNNGTFMIGGENSITWVSGANDNADADLSIYTLSAPGSTWTDDPTIQTAVATITGYKPTTINTSAEMMAAKTTWRHDILNPVSLQMIKDGTPGLWTSWPFVKKFEAVRYIPDTSTPRVEISYTCIEPTVTDLGSTRWRYTGSSTDSGSAVARYGAVSYMVVADLYSDRTVDFQGELVTEHDRSAAISLMRSVLVDGVPDGVGEYIIEKESFTDITPDGFFLVPVLGGLIVKRGIISGVEDQQMYLMMYGSVSGSGISSAYLRSHLGVEDLEQTEGTMVSIDELTADISVDIAYIAPSHNSKGVEIDPGRTAQAPIPACVYTTGSGIWKVKIWGVPGVEITGTLSDHVACRWTPDARYLCVKIAGVMYIYTPDGVEIGHLPDADQTAAAQTASDEATNALDIARQVWQGNSTAENLAAYQAAQVVQADAEVFLAFTSEQFFVAQRLGASLTWTDEVTCFQVTGSDGSYTAFTIGPTGSATRKFTVIDGTLTRKADVITQADIVVLPWGVDDTRRSYV